MFDEKYAIFSAWSIGHFVILFIATLLITFSIFYEWKTIKAWRIFAKTASALAVLAEFIFLVWTQSQTGFKLEQLPLHLCTISMYMTVYTMWTGNEKTFKIFYFWALTGGLIALIFPMHSYTFPHFRFIHYFYNHIMLIVLNIAFSRQNRICFEYKDMLKSALILLLTAFVLIPLNLILKTNFMFLASSELTGIPINSTPLWIIFLIVITFALFNAYYFLSKLISRPEQVPTFQTRNTRKQASKTKQGTKEQSKEQNKTRN